MKKYSLFIFTIVLLTSMILYMITVPAPGYKPGHQCDFPDCPMKGQLEFHTDADEGSDLYYYDLTHWRFPEWSRDSVINYVHNPIIK